MERLNWVGQSWLRTRMDKNEIRVFDDYCEMDLYDTFGRATAMTVFDLAVLDKVRELKWGRGGTHLYVIHDRRFGSPRLIYLHQLVLPPVSGMFTDHINGDVLCNLRTNLRHVTNAQNQWNTPKVRGNSKYKGVHYCKERNSFRGFIKYLGQSYTSKDFKLEEDAAHWVQQKREQLHGEFANHGNLTTKPTLTSHS